jgi:hypothetical protein
MMPFAFKAGRKLSKFDTCMPRHAVAMASAHPEPAKSNFAAQMTTIPLVETFFDCEPLCFLNLCLQKTLG